MVKIVCKKHFLLEVEMKKFCYWNCCPSTLFWTLYHKLTLSFSTNLFHRQLTQISHDKIRSPGNKKCCPWKVFGINCPQNLRLFSRRRHETVSRLHWLKKEILSFFNFLEKKVFWLDKRIFSTYWMNLESLLNDFFF